jgi:hypothetical protein
LSFLEKEVCPCRRHNKRKPCKTFPNKGIENQSPGPGYMVGMDNIRFNVFKAIEKVIGIKVPGCKNMNV